MDRHAAKTINTEAATPPRRKTASSLHPHALAYGVDEAARLVGVSRRTLYELINDKKLESKKLRGRRIVTRASLEKLLASLP